MFAQFSARLCELAMNNGYRFDGSDSDKISQAAFWIADKTDPATLTVIRVIDADKMNMQKIIEWDEINHELSESLSEQHKSIVHVYIIAGGDPSEITRAEEYFGQPVYSIFWHINLETKKLSAAPGQPKKFLNIHSMISDAFNSLSNPPAQGAISPVMFSEIQVKADNLRPKLKHRHAIVCYTIILLNLGILLLSYRHEEVFYFGVIHPLIVVHAHEWFRLFTAMFVHFGTAHFFANTFGIMIFGTRLENYLGRGIFLLTYIFSGLLGSIVSLINLYFFHPLAVSAGASGAVFGIFGAIFAYSRITKHSLDFINWYLLLIYIGINLVMGFATPGIDNFAHIGGLVGGLLIGGIYGIMIKKHAKRALDTENT
ncbi:MAG: rhomboid family intramembrane serine protease [Defluviitaleaceae bacterium]|nr:rhomboid family intramembrane serine protease [Defluviitaleaceae bacterium]